jgi:predicted nucleotidyltransferase
MDSTLLNLSRKIDDSTIQLFEIVARVAESLDIPFFVVGAMAREIILLYCYNIRTTRATEDIDLGVQVSNWDKYELLRESLLATGSFRETREPQQLVYAQVRRVDIIPFGTIAGPDSVFTWPSDHETIISTLGFDEAYQNSITVRLRSDPPVDIQFASLAALAVMKIIAWHENYMRRRKDAQDLLLLMLNYLDAGNQDRLHNQERDLVDVEDFDYVRAGARLLGRDIAAMLRPETTSTVLAILTRETDEQNRCRLVENMTDLETDSADNFEERLNLLKEMTLGILDRTTTD